ncbi:hypothetical protein GCM10010424_68400 [Streptomyces lienomycini]
MQVARSMAASVAEVCARQSPQYYSPGSACSLTSAAVHNDAYDTAPAQAGAVYAGGSDDPEPVAVYRRRNEASCG